ncbi:glycosyltransferase [Actinoplanes sp. NBRC 101535]|uniref:glycosyltransferase n=1 Tax=Actinoplanes sp. NBRC 101535 TaxID=3032196 RepID=UPI0024A2D63C|nr:glycosyltransferase [Actinoplanes sp. NBRC 101535]GLY00466.1 hypothetical protein Acsp01_08450 [Actinoplanes sp. NBRC 101535]
MSAPEVAVVIPTYDRAELLRDALDHLTRQSLPVDRFEVIVSDDGSSDHTRQVVEEFTGRLDLRYTYQEDDGNRVAAARNAGARLATAPILVFLDTGPLFGPDFLAAHVAAHGDLSEPRAVVGYAYGYNPELDMSWLLPEVRRLGPVATVEKYATDPRFRDIRHGLLKEIDFDFSRRLAPWQLFFTLNCSVRTEDFHAVGGFAESFVEWGAEDLELAFKLFRHGVGFHFSAEAWVVDVPHPRDLFDLREQLARQLARFLDLHREPVIEIGYALTLRHLLWSWEADYADLLEWQAEAEDLGVAAELTEAVRDLPPGTRLVVFGAGGDIPDGLPETTTLVEFDPEHVAKARESGRHPVLYALGLSTELAGHSADVVLITSRLSGLWARWSAELRAEANRIGRDVRTAPGLETNVEKAHDR